MSCTLENKTKTDYIIVIALFVVSFFVYSYNLEGQPRHGDEINYLGLAGNYMYLIDKGDLSNACLLSVDNCNELYHIPATSVAYSPLRMIMIGLPYSLRTHDSGDFHNWSCYWFTCYSTQNAPTIEQLTAGRLLSPLFGALTIVFAFLVGKLLFNRSSGIIFSILFLFYNLWIWYSRTIMTEVHYVFFSMLTLTLLLYSFRSDNLKKKYFVFAAMSYGCALTSKLLSIEFLPLFFGIIICKHISQKNNLKNKIQTTIILVGIFFAISLFAFGLTEPEFYKNPITEVNAMRESIDNFNRDAWFISYPTIHGLDLTRILTLFHYSLFPSPIEHDIPGAYQHSTFRISWNSPLTYSTVPMTVFFVVGMIFVIKKISSKKDCISEILLLSWFTSTLILTLMIARDLSLERYMLPFLLSIIAISSYGLWNFIKETSQKKRLGFLGITMLTHSIVAMTFWQKLYQSGNEFWTNPLPYGAFQQSFETPFTLTMNVIFVVFFAYMIITKIHTKSKIISNH